MISFADCPDTKLVNPSPTSQVRPAEGSVPGVGEEVEGL